MLTGLENVTVAMLSDSLDLVGLRDQVLDIRLAPVVPGSRAIGRARTMRFEPADEVDPARPYDDAIDAIDALSAGDIAVIATGVSNRSAFWGELFSAAASGRGAVGVITDGNLRDTAKIADLGFPAFGLGRRPIDFKGRMRLVAVDVPVTLGGVTIETGDIVGADDDGIAVVPASAAERVLDAARARASGESTVLKELLAGAGLREVWERHGIL